MNPLKQISVIIPFYNTEKYLEQAIESVLRQSFKPIELILVNDGSTDQSENIAKKFEQETILLNQENKGAAAARNKGLKSAKGLYIAFLDADDYWKPNTLEYLLGKLLEDESLGMVFGRMNEFISPELGENSGLKYRKDVHIKQGYMVGSALFHREVFDEVGLFDETLRAAEFIDWFGRAKDSGIQYETISQVVLYRRLHKKNQGREKQNHFKAYTKVLRAALARKKGL
ncbi:MAG: glycosyltransferase family 2 protein [Balneolaceae bacterium]|nr:glycosyltransferase family 2 protein [Balneolaceae bacterium]